MKKLASLLFTTIATAAVVLAACTSVGADEVGLYSLNSANTGLCPTASCTTYAEVKIEIKGNSATFTVTSPIGLGFFGSGGPMFGFNARDSSGNGVPLTMTQASSPLISQGRAPRQISSFGKFDFVITGPTANKALTSFSFTVTCSECSATNPLTLGTFEFFLTPSRSFFAAHAICYTCTGGGTTGFVGKAATIPNPEPASILLLGMGLAAVAAALRNPKRI